jgi:hypothetical protein
MVLHLKTRRRNGKIEKTSPINGKIEKTGLTSKIRVTNDYVIYSTLSWKLKSRKAWITGIHKFAYSVASEHRIVVRYGIGTATTEVEHTASPASTELSSGTVSTTEVDEHTASPARRLMSIQRRQRAQNCRQVRYSIESCMAPFRARTSSQQRRQYRQ